MIKTAAEGGREFRLARVGTILASSAEVTKVTRLISIAWFAPSLIILRARGSTISIISLVVISRAALALTSIVSRRRVGII